MSWAGRIPTFSRRGLVPPIYDDFYHGGLAASTVINGLTTITGKAVWQTTLGSGTTNALKLTGTGELFGSNNSGSPAATLAFIDPGVTPSKWVTRRFSPFSSGGLAPGNSWVDNATWSGSGNVWNKTFVGPGAAPPTLGAIRSFSGTGIGINTTPTAREGGFNLQINAGDSFGYRKRTDGSGHVYFDLYHKGHCIFFGTRDMAGDGVVLNDQSGFAGSLSNTAARQVDSLMVGDPASQAMITLDRQTTVAQLNLDGSVDLHLRGEYSFAVPAATAVTFTLFSVGASSITPVTGYVNKPVTALVTGLAGGGAGALGCYSTLAHIAMADLPANYIIEIQWVMSDGSLSTDASGIEKAGEVLLTSGQSLNSQAWNNATSGATPTGFYAEGSPSAQVVASNASGVFEADWRYLPSTAIKGTSVVMSNFATLSSLASAQLCMIEAGVGGTYLHDYSTFSAGREVGTTCWDAMVSGIKRAGGNLMVMVDNSFQNEATNSGGQMGGTFNSTQQAQCRTSMDTMVDAIEALVGHAIKVILMPINGYNTTGADATYEIARRMTWQWAQDNPTRYMWGPQTYDIQHATSGTDVFHHNSYDEQNRRVGFSWAKARGFISVDRCGPKMVSAHRVDAQTIDVTFDIDGADSIGTINPTIDPRVTLSFSTSNAFGSEVTPTSVAVQSTTVLRFTFSTGAATPIAYVRGPWGGNPINRAHSTLVNADVATLASWIVATRTGEVSIPLNPYYSNVSGSPQDYLVVT